MEKNPVQILRSALEALLDGAEFNYEAGNTRQLVRQGQTALRRTVPAIAHERAVGIFRYDSDAGAFIPADEGEAKDSLGNLRPGYEYLFRQPPELVPS